MRTWSAPAEPVGGTPEQVTEQLLARLAASLVEEPVESPAVLRSMPTHPDATRAALSAASGHQEQLSESIPGDDADVRAALISATLIRHATPEQIVDLMRRALRSLTNADAD